MAPSFSALLLAVALTVQADPQLDRYQATELQMGARFSISVYAPSQEAAEKAITAAFARVEELNGSLSDYLPDSELNRLCRSAPHKTGQEVSADLLRVLQASQSVRQKSGGAFDVSVGPLTRLWRKARRSENLPAPQDLAAALQAVGAQHIEVADKRVTLKKPGMQLDLGGIAKGYAADEALAVLKRAGLSRAMINAGGDIVAGDPPPGRDGWRIGIAPLSRGAPPSEVMTVSNQSVATSGDAWQFVEINGVRYSHIINPRTGLGLTLRSSVTAVARDGMTADAYASAFSVMGPAKGVQLAKRLKGVSTLFVYEQDGKVHVKRSEKFPQTARLDR